jgi:SAM-dependent methyltransferase
MHHTKSIDGRIMSAIMETTAPARELGFSIKQGVNWSEYLDYRPVYPPSFFDRIYSYHAGKPHASWSVAHDIGAGCGIVSASLAARFPNVIVSDPNPGYVSLARQLLVERSPLTASAQFRFLQEGGEKSSVESGTVDVLTACECIQWTDLAVAIREIRRGLKVGGTAAFTHYTVPRIIGNPRAQHAWKSIWNEYSKRANGPLLDHAVQIINTALDCLEFPRDEWESVRRVHINAQGDPDNYRIDERRRESRVQGWEEVVWEEGDEDWAEIQGIQWFKGYLATWVPVIPESEIQGLWEELEVALEGGKVRIETPLTMVFATKRV